jgi:hypothetical protein
MSAIVQFGLLATGSSSNGVTTARPLHSSLVADRVRRSPSTLRCRRG